MSAEFTPVSKDEFFRRLYAEKRDVHPRIATSRWPYTSIWEFHHDPGRPAFGKSVERGDPEGGTDYFLARTGGGNG